MLCIVDVLSYSTCLDVALTVGATVLPFEFGDRIAAAAAAEAAHAILAGRRGEAGPTLSPASLRDLPPGTRLLLPSPNGAALSRAGGATPLLAGCLRNARAVAAALQTIAADHPIGIIAAGERWPDHCLRPAIEDLLGAGAILDALDLPFTPEAQIMRDAWRNAQDPASLIAGSISGRELIDRGFPDDVAMAVEIDVSATAPMLRSGAFAPFTEPP